MNDPDSTFEDDLEPTRTKPLGHGGHWAAMGLEGDALLHFVMEAVQNNSFHPELSVTPWPNTDYPKLSRMEASHASLRVVALAGEKSDDASLTMLSAFPTFTRTTEWVVEIEDVTDSYGPYEGTVIATVASGHCIEIFATDFEIEAQNWRKPGLARVAVVGLALDLVPYAAEPWIIREGPAVELKKQELRESGRHAEADDPNFQVVIETSSMRTFFSMSDDDHMLIGKIISVTAIKPLPQFPGWRMEIECLPREQASGHRLVVYAFPPAWKESTPPRKGQMVEGTIWLQGSWFGGDPEENARIWKESEYP